MLSIIGFLDLNSSPSFVRPRSSSDRSGKRCGKPSMTYRHSSRLNAFLLLPGLLLLLSPTLVAQGSAKMSLQTPAGLSKIQHFVFILKENRSFDHYFGAFPGADGASTA